MSLKSKFLMYVEVQRGARHTREVHGPDAIATVEAYQKANQLKREVLTMIEDLERQNDQT